MEAQNLDVICHCEDCGRMIIEGVVTESDGIFCFDCADSREARWLNMIEDDYYDCRGLDD